MRHCYHGTVPDGPERVPVVRLAEPASGHHDRVSSLQEGVPLRMFVHIRDIFSDQQRPQLVDGTRPLSVHEAMFAIRSRRDGWVGIGVQVFCQRQTGL